MVARWVPWTVAAGVGVGILALAGSARAQPERPGGGIIDRRAHAELTDKAARNTRTRPVEDVYALVLHQMGFSRGSAPSRYDRVTAHYLVLPDGGVYQLHDHAARLPAASGLNTGSVSVEFAGNLPSRARSTNPSHFWSPDTHGMNQLTRAQVAGGRMLVDTLHRQGWLTHILAHRQGGPGRGLDPGPDIWREVGAWAVQQYGLDWGGPEFAVSGGSPIPAHWWGNAA
ncbi:MAG: N-acetylmuramoyl-L-alanine amidase [Deltaproteobacteria bacterium]|nr:N-acetylmuramoyl-L-alanine amidase [Deltaproteobacteria bacterium]